MKSYLAKPQEVERQWLLVDATDLVLGRMSARVAAMLRGKHKPTFTPNVDTGDFVVIINAEKVRLTSDKALSKIKYRHSGIPGGFKKTQFGVLMAKDPADTVRQVIKGMLPHNALGRQMVRKLKVYAGGEHPHEAQQPVDVTESFRQ
ncbi:MAG TPA: 50S ribosomal protein L13 [Armatimonadota bacterium]|nr:50S ribosomal protein L13 [Armatimonadota bacterium]